jgi:hypothetical protein
MKAVVERNRAAQLPYVSKLGHSFLKSKEGRTEQPLPSPYFLFEGFFFPSILGNKMNIYAFRLLENLSDQ